MRYTRSGQKTMTDGDLDYRYTFRVYLLRDGRPKYWEFHCIYCGIKVCELNSDVAYGIDLTHESGDKVQRQRCPGRTCRMWYEFVLN